MEEDKLCRQKVLGSNPSISSLKSLAVFIYLLCVYLISKLSFPVVLRVVYNIIKQFKQLKTD